MNCVTSKFAELALVELVYVLCTESKKGAVWGINILFVHFSYRLCPTSSWRKHRTVQFLLHTVQHY